MDALQGAASAELQAIAQAAAHRLERGIWTRCLASRGRALFFTPSLFSIRLHLEPPLQGQWLGCADVMDGCD